MRPMLTALAALAATAIGCEEPTPCTTNDQCAAAEVCAASSCVPALGVEYTLASASAEGISDFRPPPQSGLWDTGEDPDPFLVLTAGEWTCQTFHATNTKAPVWDGITACLPLVIEASTRFGWSLWDHDGNDPPELIAEIAEGEAFGVTAEELHGVEDPPGSGAYRYVVSTVGDVTVELQFQPPPQE